MKVKYFIYLFAVVLVTIAVNLKDRRNQDLNLVGILRLFLRLMMNRVDLNRITSWQILPL